MGDHEVVDKIIKDSDKLCSMLIESDYFISESTEFSRIQCGNSEGYTTMDIEFGDSMYVVIQLTAFKCTLKLGKVITESDVLGGVIKTIRNKYTDDEVLMMMMSNIKDDGVS